MAEFLQGVIRARRLLYGVLFKILVGVEQLFHNVDDERKIMFTVKIDSTEDALKQVFHDRGLLVYFGSGIATPHQEMVGNAQLCHFAAEHGFVGQVAFDDREGALV